VLKRPHHIINYQQMKSGMPCSWMGPIVLWENVRDGRLLYGVLHDESLTPLKDKVNRASLQ